MARDPHHGWTHQKARAWYVERYAPGKTRCAKGGEVLTQPARYLDLAHNPSPPPAYLGLACQAHNRGDFRDSGRYGTRTTKNRTRRKGKAKKIADREADRRRRLARRMIFKRDEGDER